MSGILHQRKDLPIRLTPLTIELTLVDEATVPIVSHFADIAANAGFADANASTAGQMQNVCDLIALDSGLNESYIKLVEEGNKLTLNDNTFVSQYQTIFNQIDFSINLTRSLTRLKSVYTSL